MFTADRSNTGINWQPGGSSSRATPAEAAASKSVNMQVSQARGARAGVTAQLDCDDILRSPVRPNMRANSQGDRFRSSISANDLMMLASSTEEFLSEFKGSLASMDSGHRSLESMGRSASQDLNMPATPIDFDPVRNRQWPCLALCRACGCARRCSHLSPVSSSSVEAVCARVGW